MKSIWAILRRRFRSWGPELVLLAGLTAGMSGAGGWLALVTLDHGRHQFALRHEQLADQLAENIDRRLSQIRSLLLITAAWQRQGTMPGSQAWREIAAKMRMASETNGIIALDQVLLVRPETLAQTMAELAQDARFPPFTPWPLTHRDQHCLVIETDLPAANTAVLGFDLCTVAGAESTLMTAAAAAELRLSDLIPLPHFADRRSGLIMALPLHPPPRPDSDPLLRQQSWITATLDPTDLFRDLVAPHDMLHLELFDRAEAGGAHRFLALSHPPLTKDTHWSVLRTISFAGQVWTLRVSGSPEPDPLQLPLAAFALLAGLLVLATGRTVRRYQRRSQRLREQWSRAHDALTSETQAAVATTYAVNTPVILTDERGLMTALNRLAEQVTGVEAKRWIGEPAQDLFPSLLWPGEGGKLRLRGDAGRPGHPWLLGTWYSRDGSFRMFEWTLTTVSDRTGRCLRGVITGRDVSTQNRMHAELRMLRLAVEQSPMTVMIVGSHGRIQYVNRRFEQISGWSRHEVEGRLPLFLHSRAARAQLELLWHTIAAGSEWRGELLCRRKDGSVLWELLAVSPLRGDDGTINQYVIAGEDITDLKRTETALRHTEAAISRNLNFVQTLINTLPVPLFALDHRSRFLVCNQPAAAFIGRPVAQILGHTLSELAPAHLPAGLPFMSGENQPSAGEYDIPTPDGSLRTVISHRASLPATERQDAVTLVILIDITDRKRAEAELRDSEERLHLALTASRTGTWSWEIASNSLRWDHHFAGLFQLDDAEHEHRFADFLALIDPADRDTVAATAAQVVAQSNDFACDFRVRLPDGRLRHMTARGQVLRDLDNRPLRMAGVCFDDTERRDLQAQLIQAAKLVTIGEMAAGIAHELAQPLNIIRLSAEAAQMTLGRRPSPEALREPFALIEGQAERMAEIVDHIRLFSRKEITPAKPFDAIAAIRTACGLSMKQVNHEEIELLLHLPERPFFTIGQRIQLEQVIMNLLMNARDAIRQRAIREADAPPGRIEVRAEPHQGRLEISVSDSGSGIPDLCLPHIFDPFFTTKEAGKGTGLGLSISRGIIEAMNGRIAASNLCPGPGALFTVSLPSA